ncbi:MAG TPA: hypothetical protein VK574_21610 [Terracidiphilus sp.]|nr:hypothetical protein [Terracidiphilus sp.]
MRILCELARQFPPDLLRSDPPTGMLQPSTQWMRPVSGGLTIQPALGATIAYDFTKAASMRSRVA